jgi:hypothetical protein
MSDASDFLTKWVHKNITPRLATSVGSCGPSLTHAVSNICYSAAVACRRRLDLAA